MLLERAQRAGQRRRRPMLLAARQALQTAINEVASATGAAAVEPARSST
ncbi:hypothetical protein HS125_12565 [bacterium]|nr:hypothetical protein [bacterium]